MKPKLWSEKENCCPDDDVFPGVIVGVMGHSGGLQFLKDAIM